MHLAMLLLSAALTAPPSYVLVTPTDASTIGSFTADDIETIRNAYGPRVFFFRNNARAYVVFDAKVIDYVGRLFRLQPTDASQKVARQLATLTEQWIRSGVAKSLQR